MVLINISNLRSGLTGLIAQKCLEDCGIIINMNKLPYDKKCAAVTSGIRLGTPIVTRNGMGPEEIDHISGLINEVLRKVRIISDKEYRIEEAVQKEIKDQVTQLSHRFPPR